MKPPPDQDRPLPELFDTHPVPMWVYDPATLRFLAVNPAMVARYGYTADEFLALTMDALLHPEDVPRLRRVVAETCDQALFHSGRWRHRTRGGESIHVEATSHALSFKGRPARLVMALDVTERVRAEEALRDSEERLRGIVEQAVDGIVTIDDRGTIQSVNPAVTRIFGYSPDEVIGRNVSVLMPEPYSGEHDGYIANYLRTGERSVIGIGREVEGRRKDGTVFPLELSVGEVRLRTGRVFTGIVHDITHRKRVMDEREALIARLEDQNAEMERFVYTVSHDLKSPLITIKGFLGHLEAAARSGNWDRFTADLARIGRAADRMQALLNDLLELSRIGRVINPPHDIRVEDCVAEAVQQLAGPIAARGVTVRVQPDLPAVRADPVRMTEVFANLVGNAVKFLGGQPAPTVEVGFRAADGVLFVRDNGVGIDPAYHTRVFNLFERLDPQTEGTGVGLAIVKRIVEFHGGRVWVESAGVGRGSTFCFTLPTADSPDGRRPPHG